MNMSTLQRPVLLLKMSTSQRKGMSCTWMRLYNSSHAAPGLIYTAEACAVLGPVYTLGPELHLDMSTLQNHVLHLDVFTLQWPELHLNMSCKV
jgi:hypothetical protein